MSCGLGAIILVFMLVKHNVEKSILETDLLQSDLQRLQQKQDTLSRQISDVEALIQIEQKRKNATQSEIQKIQAALSLKDKQAGQKKDDLASLKTVIKNTPIAKKADVIEDERGGEENYVMGLKVEGRKIAILVDSSASMTDEKLINIIKRKNTSSNEKRNGPKWRRTKKTVQWLLSRVPKRALVSVVAFAENARILGGANWINGRDGQSLSAILDEMDVLIPEGATNLQKGLDKVAALKPTNLYVITDGLPTAGESRYASLNPFATCGSLLGSSSTISGECRKKLFRQTILESAPSGITTNVILLPLEGDPEASPEYWSWASSTGGLLISPAVNWP